MVSLETEKWRRCVAMVVAALFIVLWVYRLYTPTPGIQSITALLLGVTVTLLLFHEHTTPDLLRHIRDQRRQLRPYTALVTTLITGVMIILFTYLITYGLMVASHIFRRSTLLAQLFFEAVQHVRLFESVHPIVFAGFYIIAGTMMTIAVILIYPHLPIKNNWLATIVTFLASWVYTLSFAYLVLPIIHPLTAESLVIDAVIVVVWAVMFAYMYGKPIFPNPFLKTIGKEERVQRKN